MLPVGALSMLSRTRILGSQCFQNGRVAKGSSVSWVAKFKGDKNSECKLSNGWSWSYKEVKLLLSAGKWVVAKLQWDKSASQSSMELHYPWISGPLRVSWRMAILGASLLLCIYSEAMLLPDACRASRASARRIVLLRGLDGPNRQSLVPVNPFQHFFVEKNGVPQKKGGLPT